MIPQDSPQWTPARVGKLTASRMAEAIAVRKDGKPAADRINLLHELLAERVVGAKADNYVSPAMQWGLDQEPFAVEAFEAESGELLLPAGLIDHPTIENFAATPDRFLGSDGLVEFKCPTTKTFITWKMNGVVPEEHRPQILAQLACTRRTHAVFCAFDPRLPEGKRLFIRTWTPDPKEIAKIEQQARDFLAELDRMFEQYTTTA